MWISFGLVGRDRVPAPILCVAAASDSAIVSFADRVGDD